MRVELAILIGCLAAGSTVMAQPPGVGDGPPRGKPGERHQKMLEKFDADGDGSLSDAEKQAAKEAFEARRAEHREKMMLKHFDEDGDGVLSEPEQAAAQEAHEQRLAKFDLDGDGELSREEHQAARAERRAQKKAGDGQCKGKRGPAPQGL